MILARADRELRALVAELRDDAAVAKRLGVELDGEITLNITKRLALSPGDTSHLDRETA